MASSSSSGGMSNMSRLMASSRLSSYHPKINQVYTAPPSHIARGDFGVKRPLPTRHIPIGKIRYVDFANLDSRYRQTDWREREREVLMLKRFSELNIQLTTNDKKRGPKISTKYDYSTKRMVPSDYDMVPDEEIKQYLQAQARLGKGPVYPYSLASKASLGAMANYSDNPELRYNYRRMSEKQFKKYLEEVREKRESFKDFLANRAANIARSRVAQQYKQKRERLEVEAEKAEGDVIQVPEEVSVTSLPLLKRSEVESDSGIQIDLWDEARLVEPDKSPWEPWLKSQDIAPIRQADSQQLPPQCNKKGGYEIPTPLHPHGGLQYSQPDLISTQLLYDSLPARVLGSARDAESRVIKKTAVPKSRTQEKSVAIAGRIATMDYGLSNSARPIDVSGNETTRGNIRVKIVSATRVMEDDSINRPVFSRFTSSSDSTLPPQYGNTVLTVRASEQADEASLAKGVPGSTEWIARLNGRARFSGQGQDGPLDYTNMNAMVGNSGRRALDEDSDRQRIFGSPEEKRRKTLQERLKRSASSTQRHVDDLWKAMDSVPIRRERKGRNQSSSAASFSEEGPGVDETER